MKDIVSNLISLSAQVIAIPIGFLIGQYVADWMSSLGDGISGITWPAILLLIVVPALGIRVIKWALPAEESVKPKMKTQVLRVIAIFGLLT